MENIACIGLEPLAIEELGAAQPHSMMSVDSLNWAFGDLIHDFIFLVLFGA